MHIALDCMSRKIIRMKSGHERQSQKLKEKEFPEFSVANKERWWRHLFMGSRDRESVTLSILQGKNRNRERLFCNMYFHSETREQWTFIYQGSRRQNNHLPCKAAVSVCFKEA